MCGRCCSSERHSAVARSTKPESGRAVRGGRVAGHAQADVVEGDRAVQPGGEHLADQVGHLAAGPLALQPAGDGGVFVPQGQAAGPARLVDVCGEAGVGDPGLVEDRVEQGVGLHWAPPVARCAISVVARAVHTGCERSARIRSVRALSRRVSGRLTEMPRKRPAGPSAPPRTVRRPVIRAVRPAACPTLRGGADGSAGRRGLFLAPAAPSLPVPGAAPPAPVAPAGPDPNRRTRARAPRADGPLTHPTDRRDHSWRHPTGPATGPATGPRPPGDL